jgi:hypothetical protein
MDADIEDAFQRERRISCSMAPQNMGRHFGNIAANRCLENMNLHLLGRAAGRSDGRSNSAS